MQNSDAAKIRTGQPMAVFTFPWSIATLQGNSGSIFLQTKLFARTVYVGHPECYQGKTINILETMASKLCHVDPPPAKPVDNSVQQKSDLLPRKTKKRQEHFTIFQFLLYCLPLSRGKFQKELDYVYMKYLI